MDLDFIIKMEQYMGREPGSPAQAKQKGRRPPVSENNIFHMLTQDYYQFTSAEKRVADFVVSNAGQAQAMSISEMAAACRVAEATVSRFCRRLGYSGYAAFKLAIATSANTRGLSNPLSGEVTPEDSIASLAEKLAAVNTEAIQETQDLLDDDSLRLAADILARSDKVLCMGQGGSMLLAQEAAHLFTTAFSGYFPVTDSHMQSIYASSLTERDAILYFSYSGTTTGLMDVLGVAKPLGVPVILATRSPNSPGAAQADVVLQCGAKESPLQLGSIPARIAQLYLMDVLFSEVCRRDLEGCLQRKVQVADALAEKHI